MKKTTLLTGLILGGFVLTGCEVNNDITYTLTSTKVEATYSDLVAASQEEDSTWMVDYMGKEVEFTGTVKAVTNENIEFDGGLDGNVATEYADKASSVNVGDSLTCTATLGSDAFETMSNLVCDGWTK